MDGDERGKHIHKHEHAGYRTHAWAKSGMEGASVQHSQAVKRLNRVGPV